MDEHLTTTVDAGYYRRVLVRGLRVVLVCVALGVALGLVVFTVLPRTYTSTASLLVTSTGVSGTSSVGEWTVDDEVNLDTEAQLVTSAEVVDRALTSLGDQADASTVADQVSVQVPSNTTVLSITYSAETPELAQAGAEAFAQAYLDSRRSVAQEDVDQRISTLQDQLESARTEQATLQRQADRAGGAEAASLQAEVQAAAAAASDLAQSVSSLRSILITPGRVINQAEVPDGPTSPQALLVLGSTTALGLLVGLLLAAWREKARPRLVEGQDVERETGLSVVLDLPTHPATPSEALGHTDEVVTAREWRRFLSGLDTDRVLLVPGDDRADALACGTALAWQAARRGRPVRLVLEQLPEDGGLPVPAGATGSSLVWDMVDGAPVGVWSGTSGGGTVTVVGHDGDPATLLGTTDGDADSDTDSSTAADDTLVVLVAGAEGELTEAVGVADGAAALLVIAGGASAASVQTHLPTHLVADGRLRGALLHRLPARRVVPVVVGALAPDDAEDAPVPAGDAVTVLPIAALHGAGPDEAADDSRGADDLPMAEDVDADQDDEAPIDADEDTEDTEGADEQPEPAGRA
ncbi:hypothetical protein [Nocardioides bruguierae]|uniref:Polysaccharide chain length determinant N-terminal domain-containing protein n=1 Tax=Nocardioides bruguierae TaxID=2945102 RepID=A0A9X2D6A3_9ACTN|nr:hypothetical protein [Nocardioides bruguierae]MCM0619951.1 hypothetical protein [Nocardioides bruguierae]